MNEQGSVEKALLRKLTDIVLANLINENFSAKELAKEAGMSYITLHRRLKSINNQSISEFIREIRLRRAMEMIQNNEGTSSEISYRTGFSSPNYFNKCFHEFYDYPPGEVRKRELKGIDINQDNEQKPESEINRTLRPERNIAAFFKNQGRKKKLIILSGILSGLFFLYFLFQLSSVIFQERDLQLPEKSIIVIPFKNIGNDPENQYYAEGVTEDIRNNLYRIKEFRVISRTITEQLAVRTLTSKQIAGKLKVNYILEGSVQKHSDKIRIYVQLIDARSSEVLWSEEYDRIMQDIFAVQSDIALQIANNLKATLSSEEYEQIGKGPTKSIESYNSYLYGRYFLNKNPQEAILNKSIEYFEKSLEADPNFTLAYAGMARAYMLLAHYGLFPWMEGRTKARELALEALKIDNTLADAHCILGNLARYDFKWEEAIKEFQLAIDYEPDNPTAHDGYAMILFATGSKEEARKQINKARELDPLSTDILETSALFYLNEGRTEEFGGELRKIMEIDSGNNHVYRLYPSYYLMKGDTLNAIRAQRKVCDTDPVYSKYATEMMNIYNKFGYKAAMEFLLKVEIENKNPIYIAALCMSLNRKEEALTWLEKAYEEHHSMLYNIYYVWPFASLRSEPRFQAIIRKMGLSEYINRI